MGFYGGFDPETACDEDPCQPRYEVQPSLMLGPNDPRLEVFDAIQDTRKVACVEELDQRPPMTPE